MVILPVSLTAGNMDAINAFSEALIAAYRSENNVSACQVIFFRHF